MGDRTLAALGGQARTNGFLGIMQRSHDGSWGLGFVELQDVLLQEGLGLSHRGIRSIVQRYSYAPM